MSCCRLLLHFSSSLTHTYMHTHTSQYPLTLKYHHHSWVFQKLKIPFSWSVNCYCQVPHPTTVDCSDRF
jgi:hypothetical protein